MVPVFLAGSFVLAVVFAVPGLWPWIGVFVLVGPAQASLLRALKPVLWWVTGVAQWWFV